MDARIEKCDNHFSRKIAESTLPFSNWQEVKREGGNYNEAKCHLVFSSSASLDSGLFFFSFSIRLFTSPLR